MKNPRIIISGGGTGGHIFPAISIANALKKLQPNAEILFVGAEGRMEMQRIPQAGYNIIGLPVKGLIRPLWNPRNIFILWDYLRSKQQVKKIIRDFRPDVAVGVGGYASAATLNAAYDMGIPCLIQEQNSFAGLTNKTLAKKAQKICVAYEGMERFFGRMKLLLKPSGNIYIDSSDLKYLFEEEDGSLMIDLADDYYGQLDYQMEYVPSYSPRTVLGESFDWLYVDFDTLAFYAEQNGFIAELVAEGEHYDYLAKLSVKAD